MKKQSILTKTLSLFSILLVTVSLQITAQKKKSAPKDTTEEFCEESVQPKREGTTFEIFQDQSSSDGCMTVIYEKGKAGSGKLKGKWSSIGNTLIRESKRPSNTTTNMSYSIDIKKMDGNAYYGGYGWWSSYNKQTKKRSNIVEFYVTDGYNDKTNPTYGMKKADLRYTVDGGTYEVYYSEKRGLGSVFSPSSNFLQIKAVRTSSLGKGKKSGNISWKTHFDKWRAHGNKKRSIPNKYKDKRGDSKKKKEANKKKRDELTAKHNSLKKFVPRSIFEISWLMEGFGSTSKVDFEANASFKSVKSKKEIADVANSTAEISLYPNPTSGAFTITDPNSTASAVMVYDISGNRLYETTLESDNITLNEDYRLSPGMYLVKILTNDEIITKKLIVR